MKGSPLSGRRGSGARVRQLRLVHHVSKAYFYNSRKKEAEEGGRVLKIFNKALVA